MIDFDSLMTMPSGEPTDEQYDEKVEAIVGTLLSQEAFQGKTIRAAKSPTELQRGERLTSSGLAVHDGLHRAVATFTLTDAAATGGVGLDGIALKLIVGGDGGLTILVTVGEQGKVRIAPHAGPAEYQSAYEDVAELVLAERDPGEVAVIPDR